ncbi:MAG TPA: hypothetical protein VLA19_15665 [Herpetosiphonaceae bacterium]|nr:hypothetical protein [Herpetosiphonaceae bacterium]
MSRMRIHGAQLALGLLLALTLWTYVSFTTNPNATDEVTIPVEPVGLADGMLIVDPSTGLPGDFYGETTVTFSGPENVIDDLPDDSFLATVNLEGLEPGVRRLEIDVEGPQSVRIRSTSPREVTVRLARELVATVPINVKIVAEPAFVFERGSITQGAREAVIRGPEEMVRRVVAATAELNLQTQTENVSVTLPLTPVDAAGNPVEGVDASPEGVAVQVPIDPEIEAQRVSVVPDVTGQPAPGYVVESIDWNPKIIEVVASDAVSGTFQTEEIDLTGLTQPISTSVALERIPNIITRPPDVQVEVRVSIIPIAVPAQLPLLVQISPINTDPNLLASADPGSIQITLEGPLKRLSELASGESVVVATVDLGGLGPGTHPVEVEIDKPDDLTIVTPLDPTVTVTLQPMPSPTPEPLPTSVPTPEPVPTP